MEIESNTRMRQRWRYLKVGRECGDKVKKVRKDGRNEGWREGRQVTTCNNNI